MENKNKRADFKIQEMAFVLLAVMILFAFVLIFFAKFQVGLVGQSAGEVRRQQAVIMLHNIASLPELRCSEGSSEINCIDKEKLDAFMKIKSNYNSLWKNVFITKVKIEQFYPEGKEYVLFETPASSTSYSTYIPLCEQNLYATNCTIGKITVSSETI